MKLVKDFIGVALMRISAIPLGLIISVVLARVLGPEQFGQYAFIMSIVPLILLPVSGGISQLLTREVAKFAQADDWSFYKGAISASHWWVLSTSFFILAMYGMGLLADLLPSDGKWGLLPIAILLVPLLGLGDVRVGTIKGLGKPAIAEMPQQLILPLFLVLYCVCAAWLGRLDARSAIWGQVIGATLAFIIASLTFSQLKPNNLGEFRRIYRLESWKAALLPFSMLAAVNMINIQIGIVALGFLSTNEQVAAMRVAERGGQFVVLSLTLVNMVIAPYIVKAHQNLDTALLQKMAVQSARGAFIIALPIAAIFVFFGESLISLIFGEDYSGISYVPLVIVTIGQLFNVFFGPVGHLLAMSGNEKDSLTGQMLALVMNVIFAIILIPALGAVGAAMASAFSTVVWNVILTIKVKRRLNIKSSAF